MAKIYDAVVVGSGAAGGMAATELCLKGLKVLMLERGPKFNTATDFDHHMKPYAFRFRGRIRPSERAMYNYTANEWNKAHFVTSLKIRTQARSSCGYGRRPWAARLCTGAWSHCVLVPATSRLRATTATVKTGRFHTKTLNLITVASRT